MPGAPAPGPAAPPALSLPEEEPALPVRLSAAATSSSVTGGQIGLNWNPDKMMEDNERMVQNVLGAVAQLTNKQVPRQEAKAQPDTVTSPLTQEQVLDVPPPAVRPAVVPELPRAAPPV